MKSFLRSWRIGLDMMIGAIAFQCGWLIAQELKPVATGDGLSVWHVLTIGGVVLALAVAGWYYGIHKRGKDAEAGAAVDNTLAEAKVLLQKMRDLIAKHDEAKLPSVPPSQTTPTTAASSAVPSTAVPPWERK